MNTSFAFLDYLIFVVYAIVILGVGLWVSRDKDGKDKTAEDYFLASKSLPWWAIGASLIAANISAEQFIGMSGSGFALGLAIASYEWMAAITLLIVGKYFLPIFIEKGLYTIPEFVEKRFSTNLKTILAVFWIALYVFVNLASVMYLGGLALETIIGIGDLSKGFAEAEIIVEREFRSQPVHQGYIEPQALVATAAADGSVDLWTTTQGHFVIRGYCARLLNMDMSSIRVTASEIGGGFGGKNNLYSEPVAIRLSQKTGRPVRFVMTRSEVFRATGPASGTYSHLRIGAKKDGTIVAAEATIYNQAGAFKGSPVGRSVDTFFSAYSIKNAKATAYDVCVNRPKVAAYRAPGAPMAALGAELAINELAAKLAIDPIEIRLKNAVQDHEQSLSGVKFGRIGLNEVLVKAREHPHYSAALAENQGRGFALGYWMHGGGLSSVNANLLDDGTVTIATGNPDIGGSRSSMRVMAAEELGVDISLIKTIIADTASIGYSHLTAGSRTTFATGLAVINSVREIIDKLRQLAATKWDVSVENVAWEAGQAVCHHGDFQALSLKQLASLAPKVGGAIAGHSEINATGAGAAFSAHIVDVEVDKETGFTTPKRYTIIQDAGRAISPDYVEGQMQGAAVQGIGWALNEEYIYDHNGCLQNAGFLDYRMPVASDVPMIDTVIVEVPNPNHPYGVRGVGEPPLVPAPAAVANAVENAIGKRMGVLPLSPPKILQALK